MVWGTFFGANLKFFVLCIRQLSLKVNFLGNLEDLKNIFKSVKTNNFARKMKTNLISSLKWMNIAPNIQNWN